MKEPKTNCARCGKLTEIYRTIATPGGRRQPLCRGCREIIINARIRDTVRYTGDATVAEFFEEALGMLGWNLNSADLKETPQRMARVFEEYSLALRQETQERIKYIFTRKFPSSYDEMVVFKDIKANTLCPHHALPVHLNVSIGYIPVKHVIGLSKLVEFVQLITKQPILQEDLTEIIAARIKKELKPLGIGVVIKAKHDCMEIRDVQQGVPIITSCLLGVMREKPETRAEFLRLIK